MTTRYYHFYTIPKAKQKARRRNVAAVRSARESREVRDWYNKMNMPTAVYVNQQSTSPDELPFNERLWK